MIINIGRKEAVFFGVIILVFAVVGFSVAFGGIEPAVMGHSAGEIEMDITGYLVGSKADGTVTKDMGPHSYCALSQVLSGGTNSYCRVYLEGNDWKLIAVDPDESPGTQSCRALCFG